jgi:hypothetical protein
MVSLGMVCGSDTSVSYIPTTVQVSLPSFFSCYPQSSDHIIKTYLLKYMLKLFFLAVLVLELTTFCLLGRHFVTQAKPQPHIALVIV